MVMQIIYHVPVLTRIISAITLAGDTNRTIDYIILNYKEWEELEHDHKASKFRNKDGTYEIYGAIVAKEGDIDVPEPLPNITGP
jgi:hypothetical protein